MNNLKPKQLETKEKITLLAKLLGVDPAWAVSIAQAESALGLYQLSSTGARGVFQMTSIAMKDLLLEMRKSDDDLIDIICGILFLRLLLKRHKTIEAATAKYCAPADRHFYVQQVLDQMKDLNIS